MSTISDYEIIEKIHIGIRTLIERGVRKSDRVPVIIKSLKSEYPTLEEIARLKHEYKINSSLFNVEGIVKTYGLLKYKNGFALILEDFQGKSLKQLLADRLLQVIDFLNIAIKLAQSLGELHQNQIIHKDIKSANIIVNPKTSQVKITDFSISTRLTRETNQIGSPCLLEGTLAYMSPEQTGRMNRSIDYRTDFYSLGITYYEMLTGQLPFNAIDPLELIHCHIALTPVPPHQINPEIPEAISSIVMKLLQKNAEDRYQSAFGLKADLETCLLELQKTSKIENFTPGQLDQFGKFLIPQKLYGRSQEVTLLMQAFERVSKGATEMILVSGYSGIGKTALVNEVHKPIVQKRGYFIAGKFDQFKRNIPYAALIQAFQSLLRQILTEGSDQIEIWKQKLLSTLGEQGQIIIDIIPELELIIGSQPAVPQLSLPLESQNRFNKVFKEFLGVFTKAEHPLVLFLDDLQWADPASLKLIKIWVTDPESKYLLMMGAYRDNEVSPIHPTIQTIDKIKENGATVNQLILQPLDINNVSQLLADTLSFGKPFELWDEIEKLKPLKSEISSLASLLFHKTGGNPFFLTQLMQTLYSENLLKFDFIKGRWFWNVAQIQSLGIIDYNIVELVAKNIQKLSDRTQHALKLAACIGNQFNLDVLAIVNQQSLLTTADDLWEGLQTGLILPLNSAYKIPLVFDDQERETQERILDWGNQEGVFHSPISYKFLHDRVQQAAYSLIPEEQKKATHLKIGKLLLQKTSAHALLENIFDIVNQLNISAELINNPSERKDLAKLNLLAGKKAKAATAYEAAFKYLSIGLEQLTEKDWENQYDLTIELYLESLEIGYIVNPQQAVKIFHTILNHAQKRLEKVKVYEIQSKFYFSQNQPVPALETSLKALKILGINLPSQPNKFNVLASLIKTKLRQGNKSIEALASLPEMTDDELLAAMRILLALSPAAFAVRPNLYPLVTFKMVNLSLKYGNTPLSTYGYGTYGLLHCAMLGDFDSGYRYGQLARTLLHQFNAKEVTAIVSIPLYVFITHWKEHIKTALAGLLEGSQTGLSTGDIEYGCHCAGFYCSYLFLSGEPLDSVIQKQSQYIDLLVQYKQEYQLNQVKIWAQVVLNFQGESDNAIALSGKQFSEETMLPLLIESENGLVLFPAYLAKALLCYSFKLYAESWENACAAEKYVPAASGSVYIPVHNFYASLALLALSRTASNKERQEYLQKVAENQKKMQQWADNSPTNYLHKYELVEAEKARLLGKNDTAAEYYDRAIKGAREQGYLQEEALAFELAAEFYFHRNREKVAQIYLTDAYYGYDRWGAKAKICDLESRYPEFFSQLLDRENYRFESNGTTSSTTGESSTKLDFYAVIKASQALSNEIVLESLLQQLIKLVMHNAGAQTVYLLLDQDGKILLEATGTVNEVRLGLSTTVENSECLPISLINYVVRTQESVVLNDAYTEGIFTADPYIIKNEIKSILCTPILTQGKLIGLLYLENNLSRRAFTTERIEVLRILTSQAAISIDKARLYENLIKVSNNLKQANQQLEDYSRSLEDKVKERTLELEAKNTCLREQTTNLEQTIKELQATQTQLIQAEKMSSLGQLVAGVAHEINNPVNFIYGNLTYANEYTESLLNLLDLYQQEYPNPTDKISAEIDEIDLEFLKQDLLKLFSSMKVGADRIRLIVLSLRNFSRLDEAQMKAVDIHEGIDSTLMLLQNRLKPKSDRPGIQVIKEYGDLPMVECYAGQLNQVLMNIIANAIDALEYSRESGLSTVDRGLTAECPTIRIRTLKLNANYVEIAIADNGLGMTEEVRSKLFDPFFTTKPVGKGTGMGLSISYQIVVDKHGGQLKCISSPGKGAEFAIEIPVQQLKKPINNEVNSAAK
ncbi:AAA family ATPase [Phormidium sp. LEGE 05292]|uniref:ATP-binding sensor histidine kinase n=1 Tax=[Phormidium] sp. LEGE 05292 TaxID=767427 RepID=UPI0018801429|nr:ATP-binding sensor histidine kinase [Phormidium sp. LEGE 05292]MBE9225259.1 AAA family ATPase [Phormidium sp. LEGE 05292]